MESAGSSTEVTSDTTMINEEEEEANNNNDLNDDDMIAEYDNDDEENDDDPDSSDDGNSQKDDDSSSDDDDSSDHPHFGSANIVSQMRKNSLLIGGAIPNSKAQTTSYQKDDNPSSKPRIFSPQDALNRKKVMDHDDDMITMYHDNWPKNVAYNRSISWQGRPLSRRTHHTFAGNIDNRNSFHASNYAQLGYQPPRKIIEHYDSKNNKRTSKQEKRYQEWLDKRKMSDQIRNLQEELDNCDIYGGIGRPENVIKEEEEPMIRFIPKSQSMKIKKAGDVNNYSGSPLSLTTGYCPTPAHSNQGSRSVSRGSSKKRRKRKKKDCNLM